MSDDEINILSVTHSDEGIERVLDELTDILKPPTQKRSLELLTSYNTGISVIIVPNCKDKEVGHAVAAILEQRLFKTRKNKIPEDCEYVILGHGKGRGSNWTLIDVRDDNRQLVRVQDFVNKNLPAGKKAFCVICSSDQVEKFHQLTGKVILSQERKTAKC